MRSARLVRDVNLIAVAEGANGPTQSRTLDALAEHAVAIAEAHGWSFQAEPAVGRTDFSLRRIVLDPSKASR